MNSFKSFLQSIFPISDADFENASRYFKSLYLPKNSYFAVQGKVCTEAAFIQRGKLQM